MSDDRLEAFISSNPMAVIAGGTDVVRSVDITHCVAHLQRLKQIATVVNQHPEHYCQAAQIMAYMIDEIERSLRIPKDMPP